MFIYFLKDYKYNGVTYYKKDETNFINNVDFAKYLVRTGYAVKHNGWAKCLKLNI